MVRTTEAYYHRGGEMDFYGHIENLPVGHPNQHRLTLTFNAETQRYEIAKHVYGKEREVCYTYPRLEDALRCGKRIEFDYTGIDTEYEVIECP